jgi:hypothetical protein
MAIKPKNANQATVANIRIKLATFIWSLLGRSPFSSLIDYNRISTVDYGPVIPAFLA